MGGKSLILKEGQILFKKNQDSDGMYVIRSGEMGIYLDDSNSSPIAKYSNGAIVGEMALLDDKPRSATVKAIKETELVHIRQDDFKNLTKQLPRWYNTLLATLSTRLRSSNDRLERLEARSGTKSAKVTMIQRLLSILDLLWHRDAEKGESNWFLEIEGVKKTMSEDFCEDSTSVENILEALVNIGFYTKDKNSSNNESLVVKKRSQLSELLELLKEYTKGRPAEPLKPQIIELLSFLNTHCEESLYESVQVSLKDLMEAGQEKKAAYVEEWSNYTKMLGDLSSEIKIINENGKIAIKSSRKEVKDIYACHRLIATICAEIDTSRPTR